MKIELNLPFKKIIIYLFFFLLAFFLLFLIYFINSNDPVNKNSRRVIKSILIQKTIKQHVFNDYRELFLPYTQFIKVNFKKIDLDFLNLNDCYFGKCYSFFL
jgi:hypothetical protein